MMQFTFSTPPPNHVQMPLVHSRQCCSAQPATGVKPKKQRYKSEGAVKWQWCQKGIKQELLGLAYSAVHVHILDAVELTIGEWTLSSVLALLFLKHSELRDLSCRKKGFPYASMNVFKTGNHVILNLTPIFKWYDTGIPLTYMMHAFPTFVA
jgi:hypothetical protein